MRRFAGIVLLLVAVAACAPATGGTGGSTTKPVIGSIVVSPSSVAQGSPVTVSWHVTDTVAVVGTTLVLRSSSSTAVITACATAVKMTSGTALDGQYSATCTVPAAQPSGTYLVDVAALDNVGGSTEDTSTTFVVTGTAGDSAAPVVVGTAALGLTSGSSGPIVTVSSLHVTDATGVSALALTLSNQLTHTTAGLGTALLVSGTSTDGMYAGQITVFPGTPAGTYDVSVAATDTFGNAATTILGSLGIGA